MTIADFSTALLNPQKPLHIHLIGVAGSGMSGLARLLLEMGHTLSGSDQVTSGETENLRNRGLTFFSPQTPESVQSAHIVIYSSAIRETNPALAEARRLGLHCFRRAECLAAIMRTKKGVIVSGTHGKTTTSAMTAHLLKKGGLNPCHYVGAEIPILGSNAAWNQEGQHLIAEGDESDGTLALYHPQHTIILNIEEEHLDYYQDITHIRTVFQKLIHQTTGSIVYCSECPEATRLCADLENSISYGWENAHWTATDLVELHGTVTFNVNHLGKKLGRVELGVPGLHNVLNSLGAIALANLCGNDFQLSARALSSFAGAKRRFETTYLSPRYRLVDDYGHHPSEITATLQTARSLKPKRLIVLFQPHRYSRTQRLAHEFGKTLQAADLIYITSIYEASEDPIPGITGDTIVQATIAHGHKNTHHLPDLHTAHHTIGNALQEGDLFITLGAGNVHEAGKKIAQDLAILEDLRHESEVTSLKLYEPMRRHTTILVGGPAQFWIEPSTFQNFAQAVSYCKNRGIPVRIIGRGSNLLIRDGGIRGAVIHPTRGAFSEITVKGDTITAGAGVRFKKIASVAQAAGIGGFEWMEGIPGNVGGGLRMNAGAMGIETFHQVTSVTLLNEHGELETRQNKDITAHYRNVPELRSHYALQATFQGKKDTPETIQKRLHESKQKRRTSQPIAASAGCIFKNPTTANPPCGAGQLIDELGLKNTAIGKAQISQEHGNFIVNRGQATAAEVLELIELIKTKAKTTRQIDLETEVQILGEDNITF